jgi:carbamoyl-phosphate synthase small subunit
MINKGILTLSNALEFSGDFVGSNSSCSGELVFTTGMVGYSEALTDPSYFGQILVFTYPLIGNYGIPFPKVPDSQELSVGFESDKVRVAGVILSTPSVEAYHWQSNQTLLKLLCDSQIPVLAGVDTRHLVKIIRSTPNLLAKIEKITKSQNPVPFFDPSNENVLPKVSRTQKKVLGKGKKRIALLDCGVKWSIVRQLLKNECEVELLPWDTNLRTVDCNGWVLSNGPGDPANTGPLKNNVATLLKEKRPILGICLGHQILALAAGAQTERLRYGHRSHNQPVIDLKTAKGYLTSQNHGYTVIEKTLPQEWSPWFKNANDLTIEGIVHESNLFKSVQFHPEAAGGPRDTEWIIQEFVRDLL